MRERDDLPLPDYNQLQVGSLTFPDPHRARMTCRP